MDWPTLLLFPLLVFLVAMAGTSALIAPLTRRAILDHPNERSSHTTPTPTGGGLAVIGALVPAWALIGFVAADVPVGLHLACSMALALAAVSWADDLWGVSPLVRLAVQAAAVGAVLTLAPFSGPIFGGLLPPLADRILAGILWVWFINLYNFMDGIDGLAGVQTLALGAGIFVISRKLGLGDSMMVLGLCAAFAALGFLRWNWHPARIFLGDVGSVPLGFLLGWLLLTLAAKGAWAAAIILPLYYLADATITLVRRLARGERIWEAHREHFYQKAVASGLRHGQVSGIIGVCNMFLIMLTIVAARGFEAGALFGAAAAVAWLLFLLAKGGPTE